MKNFKYIIQMAMLNALTMCHVALCWPLYYCSNVIVQIFDLRYWPKNDFKFLGFGKFFFCKMQTIYLPPV